MTGLSTSAWLAAALCVILGLTTQSLVLVAQADDTQYCMTQPACEDGNYRAGCYFQEVQGDDDDDDDGGPQYEYDPGQCTPCSNGPLWSSYTDDGGQENACPWECVHETMFSGTSCTFNSVPPNTYAFACTDEPGTTMGAEDNCVNKVDDTAYAFIHKTQSEDYEARVQYFATDNSGGCDVTLTQKDWNSMQSFEVDTAECSYLGKEYLHTIVEDLAINSFVEENWVTEQCVKMTVKAEDASGQDSSYGVYLCASDNKPQITFDDSQTTTAGAIWNFNKKAVNIANDELNWTDTLRNTQVDNGRVFQAMDGAVDLSGLIARATDNIHLDQMGMFCALDQDRNTATDWGSIQTTCQYNTMSGCAIQNPVFIPNLGVTKIFSSTMEDTTLNLMNATFGLDCGVTSITTPGEHNLQVMARNIDMSIPHSVSWKNYRFSIYSNTVVFGGGGDKESSYASSAVYIPFTYWDNAQIINDPENTNDGLVLIQIRKPWLNFVANAEGLPIKSRKCRVDEQSYVDCHQSSDGTGKWRPASNLASGEHTFQMKVEDWAGSWVTVKKSFVIDASPASVTWVSKPNGLTYDNEVQFVFKANEPSCNFKWRRVHTHDSYGNATGDTASWTSLPLSSSDVTQTIGEGYGNGTTEGVVDLDVNKLGKHLFQVRAIDSAGNEGPTVSFAWELSPQISHTTDNDQLIREFVIRTSGIEEHCEEYDHCLKTVSFTTSYTGGEGFVNVEVKSLPEWLTASKYNVNDYEVAHTLTFDGSKITNPGEYEHTIRVSHMDKLCSSGEYCRSSGGVSDIDGYSINEMNVARPNRLFFRVRVIVYEPPTLRLEPDNFLRKLAGGIEIDITQAVNVTVNVHNDGDFPLKWKFVELDSASSNTDECGFDEQKEYIGSTPNWVSVTDASTGVILSTDVNTLEARSVKAVSIRFDSQQLRTSNYRVALVIQSNDYDLSDDAELDSDRGYNPSLDGYEYNGCSSAGDWQCISSADCVTDQPWSYIRDIGGRSCDKMISNSGQFTERPLEDQIENEQLGWRFLAMDIEGIGASTLIFLPKKLPKAYVAAGTEVRQTVTLVSMVGACNAYFVYDVGSFAPQYDGLLEKDFWVYLSMTKIDRNRETELITYEREPFLGLNGNLDTSLLSEMIQNGSYPDIYGSAGQQAFVNNFNTWYGAVSDSVSRFTVEENHVSETKITNSGARPGMLFGIPIELDVNFRFYERYSSLTRETSECLLSGEQREKCLDFHSMRFSIENSNDHYFGSWPSKTGLCSTLSGIVACTGDDVTAYAKVKLSTMEVEVEFEPGLCSSEQSILFVNTSLGVVSADFSQPVTAGEEIELKIFTRDYLGNDRFPPEFCRSSLECRAPCDYETTVEDSFHGSYDPITFGAVLVLGDWPEFSSQRSEPIFQPSSLLPGMVRDQLEMFCTGNPTNGDGEPLEMLTRRPITDFNQGLGGGNKLAQYVLFDQVGGDMSTIRRCWDARALMTWIEDPASWHKEDMRYYPLDKHILLSPEDITLISNVANNIKEQIHSSVDQDDLLQVDNITQWVFSTDNGDGTHSIKIPVLKAGTYELLTGEYIRTFVKRPPTSLGVPTFLDNAANISNFYRTESLLQAPLRTPLKYSEFGVERYLFNVQASDLDFQSCVILGQSVVQYQAGQQFCFQVQARDHFDNILTSDQNTLFELYMLYQERSFKNSTIVAYSSTSTVSQGVSGTLGLTYESCFVLDRAGHYDAWISEDGAFASITLEDVQAILSRGGDGQAKRLNKHVPIDTVIVPSEASENYSCIDEFDVSKSSCGNQTAVLQYAAGSTFKFTIHAYDQFGNPLQSASGYTFTGRLWGNSTTEGSRRLQQTDSSWTNEVATSVATVSNTACSDLYFGEGSTCPNEFVLTISSEVDSSDWFGERSNGTYKLTVDLSTTSAGGQTVNKRLEHIEYFIDLAASNLIHPEGSELYSVLPFPLTEPHLEGRHPNGTSLPQYQFKEDNTGIFLMPKDRFGNFLSLPVESNLLSTGVPLSPSDVRLSLYDVVRRGSVLSSVWSFEAQLDEARSRMANAVVFNFVFEPQMNGTYEMNVSIADGSEKLINGNPFNLNVLAINCEMGNQAERQTGAYCVCSPGWYDQLTADLGDIPDCQRCGIEMTGELDLTKYNTKPDQIECVSCPLCADGKTFEYADIASDSPMDCRCPDDFVRIPHLTSEEFPLNEFGKALCHPCPEGGICENGTELAAIEAEEGYWRGSPESDTFVDCGLTIAGADICSGGEIGEEFCLDGHTGPLCTLCAEGWGRAGRGRCIQCEDGQVRVILDWLQIIGTIVGLGLLVTFFVYREIKSMHEKIHAGDFARSRARTQLLKSMLSYLQIVGIAAEVQVQWNPLLTKYFNTVNSVTSDFAFESQAFACQLPSTYTQKWQAYMLTPFMASAGLLLIFYLRNCFKPKKYEEDFPDKEKALKGEGGGKGEDESMENTVLTSYMTTMLVLGFLAYPSLVRKAVEVFGCRTFLLPKSDRRDGGGQIDEAISLLSVDNSVSCLSTEYTIIRLQAMAAICVYGIGVPASVFFAIKARRNRLQEKNTLLMFGFMYSGYKEEFWWWECMSLMRKLFMSLVLVFFSEKLYIQLFLGLVVSQLFLLLQLRCKPFTTELCNVFETMSLFALWLTLQGTFLYFEGVSLAVNLSITAVLATINFGVCLFFFVMYFYKTLEEKRDKIRGPLKKVGIDIDWVLSITSKFNKEMMEVASTAKLAVFARKGGQDQSIDEIVYNTPQEKQVATFKKLLEVYDVSSASDEELALIKDIHEKLVEILQMDEFLRLGYDSPLMEGISQYMARLRSETGSGFLNPLSSTDSLGLDRRTKEQNKAYGQTSLLEGVSGFLTRFRSETGRSFQNPLSEAGSIPEGSIQSPSDLPVAEDGVPEDSTGDAPPPPEQGGQHPRRATTAEEASFLMDDISTFLTRFRSETGRNFQNPLSKESFVEEGTIMSPEDLPVASEVTTRKVSSELDHLDEAADDAKELENVSLRKISSTTDAARPRASTFKLDAPKLKPPTQNDAEKNLEYLQSIDNELLKILTWRSEIAESGRYKPLQDSKVKHIHRHSIHIGRQRAQAANTMNKPAPTLPEISEEAESSVPSPSSSVMPSPGSPPDSSDETSHLLGGRKDSSTTTSMNPLVSSRWKKAVRAVDFVANPLRNPAMDAGSSSASGPAVGLPKSMTLGRGAKAKQDASSNPLLQPGQNASSGSSDRSSLKVTQNLNPIMSEDFQEESSLLPTTLTIKSPSPEANKSDKKKNKKKNKK